MHDLAVNSLAHVRLALTRGGKLKDFPARDLHSRFHPKTLLGHILDTESYCDSAGQ